MSLLGGSGPGAGGAGSIYRFSYDADPGRFRSTGTIANSIDVEGEDGFGATVATAGDLAIIRQPGDDDGIGSVMVMRGQAGDWVSESKEEARH